MTVANPYFHAERPESLADARLKRLSATASVAVASTLIAVKFFAFIATSSVSLLSSLMDSAFDFGASLLVLVSIAHASTPADRDHRFGHGKIEALGALAQSIFISGSGVFLLAESVRRIFFPHKIAEPAIGIGVVLFSIAATAALITFQRYVVRKTGSVAVRADLTHYKGDILMNLSVLAAIALTGYTGWLYFDPIFAILIAFRLFYGAWEIGRPSFDILLDRELPDDDRARIKDIVTAHHAVRGIHDLRTRSTGERVFMEFHIELDPHMTIRAVHNVMDEIEENIFGAFPKSEVLIHPEPRGIDDHRLDEILKK